MRKFLVLLLVGLAAAGYSFRESRQIQIPRGNLCVLQFASGTSWGDGRKSVSGEQGYYYNFGGLPSWMKANGSSIYGTPPSNDNGPWNIDVSYSGAGTPGVTRVVLVPQGYAAPVAPRVTAGPLPVVIQSTVTTTSSPSYTSYSPSWTPSSSSSSSSNPNWFSLPPTNPPNTINTLSGPIPTPFANNLPTTYKNDNSIDVAIPFTELPIGSGPSIPDYSTYLVLTPVTSTALRSYEVTRPDVYVPNPPVFCDAAQRTLDNAKANYDDLVRKADAIRPLKLAATQFDEAYRLRCDLAVAETKAAAAQIIVSEAQAGVSGCKNRQEVQPIPNLVKGQTVQQTEVYRQTDYAINTIGGYQPGRCDDINVLSVGSGTVTSVGDRYIEVNGNRLDFGACTSNTYKSGGSFRVGEKVNFQSYLYAGRTWARKIAFSY